VPITGDDANLSEAFPIFREGTRVGGGFPYAFGLPEGTEAFTIKYQGRAWPLEFEILDPSGDVVSRDVWIGSNDYSERSQTVTMGDRPREGWTFRIFGYGLCSIVGFETTPATETEWLFRPAR
jgi:hypothetical protein